MHGSTMYNVSDTSFYTQNVTIRASYRMTYYETVTCDVAFALGLNVTVIHLSIESTSSDVQVEYDETSVILMPGDYNVTWSASRSHSYTVTIRQEYIGGKNVDQSIWLIVRFIPVIPGIGLVVAAWHTEETWWW